MFQRYLREDYEELEDKRIRDGMMQPHERLPIELLNSSTKKLPRMISCLQTPMQNHFLAFNEFIVHHKPEVWSQFQNLGSGDNDDAPDATASALIMIQKYGF